MIVIDLSVIVAILFNEPIAAPLPDRLAVEPERVMSIASYVETGAVLAGRRRSASKGAVDDLDRLLATLRVRLIAVDVAQGREALAARVAYGRGMGGMAGR